MHGFMLDVCSIGCTPGPRLQVLLSEVGDLLLDGKEIHAPLALIQAEGSTDDGVRCPLGDF